jgi:hypothetical protein
MIQFASLSIDSQKQPISLQYILIIELRNMRRFISIDCLSARGTQNNYCDHGTQFVARFWEQHQEPLGTKLIRSSAYHLQTDGQTDRVNKILKDILRACVIHYDKN